VSFCCSSIIFICMIFSIVKSVLSLRSSFIFCVSGSFGAAIVSYFKTSAVSRAFIFLMNEESICENEQAGIKNSDRSGSSFIKCNFITNTVKSYGAKFRQISIYTTDNCQYLFCQLSLYNCQWKSEG